MTDTFQPVAAVIVVLSLLAVVLYFLRRRGMASFGSFPSFSNGRQAASTRQMKLLERIPLGAQHALHLVRVGDRHILVATAPGSCQILNTAVQEESRS